MKAAAIVCLCGTVMACAAPASPPAQDSPGPSGPLAGTVEGRPFAPSFSQARVAGPGGGLAVDLADYAIACGDLLANVVDDALTASVVLQAGSDGLGRHDIDPNPFGGAVSASITIWHIDATSTLPIPASILLTHGSITLAATAVDEVKGWAELSTAGVSLAGSFAATFCQ